MLAAYQRALAEKGLVQFPVHALPGASQTRAKELLAHGGVKVTIAAPAERGKANVELIRFLAKEFGVARSNVEIIAGKTARIKIVRVRT